MQMEELQERRSEDARLKQEEARLMQERFDLDLQVPLLPFLLPTGFHFQPPAPT